MPSRRFRLYTQRGTGDEAAAQASSIRNLRRFGSESALTCTGFISGGGGLMDEST